VPDVFCLRCCAPFDVRFPGLWPRVSCSVEIWLLGISGGDVRHSLTYVAQGGFTLRGMVCVQVALGVEIDIHGLSAGGSSSHSSAGSNLGSTRISTFIRPTAR